MAQFISMSYQQIALRNVEEFPDSLKFVLNIVTMNEVPKVVGSKAYLTHKYPGDVDVFEQVVVQLPKENALKFYTNNFQTIAQEIAMTNREILFNEFKAGIDQRYNYKIDEDTTSEELTLLTQCLKNKNLLTDIQCDNLMKYISDNMAYKDELKLLSTVRWDIKEVIKGEKELPYNGHIYLKDALHMDSVIKLDVISYIEGRLQSVETFYDLKYVENNVTHSL